MSPIFGPDGTIISRVARSAMNSVARRAAQPKSEPIAPKGSRSPLLVKEAPWLIKHGTQITDGQFSLTILDKVKRNGGGPDLYEVRSDDAPDLKVPAVTLNDIAEWAFAKGTRRTDHSREEL